MDPVLLLCFIALLSIAAVYFTSRKGKTAQHGEDTRRREQCRGQREEDSEEERHQDQRQEEEEAEDDEEDWSQLSRLQRLKRQKERERRMRREEREATESARRETREERAKLREERDAEREAAEEAALQELREEKKRREDEEYAKWVGEIGVEERGELGDEQQQRHARVVDYLITRAEKVARQSSPRNEPGERAASALEDEGERAKCVMVLQDAARDVGVTVPELAATIEQLLTEERVMGVFDERGKFVFVSEEHFRQLAKFIKLRGRVSVVELARECNKLILK